MSTSSETHETFTTEPAGGFPERSAPAAPRPAGPERHPFPTLPVGWMVIGRCRFGTGVPGPHATGCYALAHPEVGVALIDIAPDATPNAEARLRRALTAVEFWPDFPGTLPVMHDRVDGTGLRSLPWTLERGFAALPALTVPGGTAWIEGVRRAMAVDPAWELPGQPKAVTAVPSAAADDAEPAAVAATSGPRRVQSRRWKRLAALPLAFVGTFAIGLVSGFLLLDSPAPVTPTSVAPSPVVAAAPSQTPAAPASDPTALEARPKPAEAATAVAVPPAPPLPVETSRPAPEAAPLTTAAAPVPAAAPAPTPPAVLASVAAPPSPLQQAASAAEAPAPVEAPAAQSFQQTGVPTETGAPGGPSPLETRVALSTPVEERSLPMAPPRAPSPPVRVSAPQQSPRPAPVIDRACSQALFRFQQGERLTAAEQNFIRTGCSTARR